MDQDASRLVGGLMAILTRELHLEWVSGEPKSVSFPHIAASTSNDAEHGGIEAFALRHDVVGCGVSEIGTSNGREAWLLSGRATLKLGGAYIPRDRLVHPPHL